MLPPADLLDEDAQSAALAALTGLAVVYEWDVEENGNANLKGWEWN
jgi:hypothetical protein